MPGKSGLPGGGGGSLPNAADLRRDFPLPTGSIAQSPGFNISSGLTDGGNFQTILRRRGTPVQQAFDVRFPRALQDLDRLRESVRPGFSDLRAARLNQISNARSRAIGNIREGLGRRRVLGSSFGQDVQIRAEREFGELESQVAAETFLQELDATSNLINQETGLVFNAINRELSEIGLATQFNTATSQIFSNNQQFLQQMAAQLFANESGGGGGGALSGILETGGTVGGAIIGGIYGGPAGAQGGAFLGGLGGGGIGSAIESGNFADIAGAVTGARFALPGQGGRGSTGFFGTGGQSSFSGGQALQFGGLFGNTFFGGASPAAAGGGGAALGSVGGGAPALGSNFGNSFQRQLPGSFF